MNQLIADARVAGCAERMQALMELPLHRDRYLRTLTRGLPWRERWRALREAGDLPLDWRLRKLLHSAFPNATFRLKGMLQLFHRRYWRARRAERQARHPEN
jgi:hypothetical protein